MKTIKETKTILTNRTRRSAKVRSRVSGTAERPRLSIRITNKHVSAQLINDQIHKTIAAATTVGKKSTKTMSEMAEAIGAEIATKAKKAKVEAVVLDRGSKNYHGRIVKFAESARKAGLRF